ncbi:MAG: pirin family protein [Rhodocyclaceae bacterium]|nr:pirin family protein [Rhodocyclaceae bacterium]MBK9309809.1 pirin family protein [Rhodocyclaceae bacterium]MBK9955105.1 pirin family protein [Rhodocyclaceae bacterium]
MQQGLTGGQTMSARTIESIVAGQQVTDGAGVRITRLLTQAQQRRLDPFLMLDNFRSDDPKDYIAGFPDHPHRGFETVTYMIAGRMRHRDNAGHEGLLENGGIQWMVAGRGIVHSEMPEQEDGAMEGFQLWLNLPAANKMADPWYRDFQSADIPEYTTPDGVTVRVIAGESQLRQGAVTREVTEPLYLDIHLPASSRFEQALPPGHNAFVVVYRGEVAIAGRKLRERQMAILANATDADGVIIEASSGAKAILVAGRPLNEPIAQHGPFVMNTQEQIVAAVRDYQAGRF